jgi:hypothetical protein
LPDHYGDNPESQSRTENQSTGKLEEHQSAAKDKGTKAPGRKAEQPEKAKHTVRMCEKWLTQAKRHRGLFDTNWVSNVKFAEGKQWRERRPSYRHSEVLNLTHAAIQSIIPILTDNRPNIETLPQEPDDFEFSEIMTQILRAKWDQRGFSQILAEGIVDLSTIGTVISKQEWDEEAQFGLGDYEFELVDPIHCYPDPNARDVNDKFCRRFQTAVPTDLEEVKRRYPKWAHLIKPNVGDMPLSQQARIETEDDYRVRSVSDYDMLLQSDRPRDAERPNQVLLITTYAHSDEVEEYEIMEKDKDGQEIKKFQTKKKFPNGRKIVHANGILLEDGENPFIDGKFPYARGVDHIRPRTFWGMGEVEQLRGPQEMINKLISYTMDVLILMGNPIWVVDSDSGVDTDNIVNQPGLVVEKNPNTEVRRESGVQLQPFILQTLDRLVNLFDQISGVNDVSRGATPSSNASGVAIDMLQEAAQTKLRLKSRNIEHWLTQVGKQHVARILQYYKIPRIVRLTGNEDAGKFFKVAIDEKVDEENESQMVMQIQEVGRNEETGEMVSTDIREVVAKGNLDVIIATGTTLPFAKAKRESQATKLFEMGIYDEGDYLDDIQHPRRDKILQKLQERKQGEAEAAQAEAQLGQQQQLELEGLKQGIPPQGAPEGAGFV